MLSTPTKKAIHWSIPTQNVDLTPANKKANKLDQNKAGKGFSEKDYSDAMQTESKYSEELRATPKPILTSVATIKLLHGKRSISFGDDEMLGSGSSLNPFEEQQGLIGGNASNELVTLPHIR